MKLKEEEVYKIVSHFNNIDLSTEVALADPKNPRQILPSNDENKVVNFCLSFLKNKKHIEAKKTKPIIASGETLNKYFQTSTFMSRKIQFLKENHPAEQEAVVQFQKYYKLTLSELKKIWGKNNSKSFREYQTCLNNERKNILKQIFPFSHLYNFFYFTNEILADGFSQKKYNMYTDILEKISLELNDLFKVGEYRKEDKKIEIISRWYKKNFLEHYKNRDIDPIYFIKYIVENCKTDSDKHNKTLEYYIDFYLKNSIYHGNLDNCNNRKTLLKTFNNKKIKKILYKKIKEKDIYNIMSFTTSCFSKKDNVYLVQSLIEEIDEWNYFELDQQIAYQFSGNSENYFVFIDWLEKFYPEKGIIVIDKIEELMDLEDRYFFAFTSTSEGTFPVKKINTHISEARGRMERGVIKSNLNTEEKKNKENNSRF